MVETYYNSGQFSNTVKVLCKQFDRPFLLFEVAIDFMDIGCGHYGYQSFCSWLATASVWAALLLTKPHSIKKG